MVRRCEKMEGEKGWKVRRWVGEKVWKVGGGDDWVD